MDEYFIENKSSYDRILDFLVFIAVLVVTVFLILDIVGQAPGSGVDEDKINSIYLWVNIVVFTIFAVDLIRLWRESENAKDFFQTNFLDILATIPFELIALAFATVPADTAARFAILKWVRITKLSRAAKFSSVSRVSKVSKEFKAASHAKKEGENYKKKHRL